MIHSRQSAPPAAWLLALLLVLPMPMPLIAPVNLVEPAGLRGRSAYNYHVELRAYLSEERRTDGRQKGVMLAMSGGSCAVAGPIGLSDNDIDMYVVYIPDATLDSFGNIMDVLIDGKPDFLVIQDTVTVLKKPRETAQELYEWARSHWVGQIYGIVRNAGLEQIVPVAEDSWKCNVQPLGRSLWANKSQSLLERVEPFSLQSQIEVKEFLGRFTGAGIPVLIASPPKNTYTNEYRSKIFNAASELVTAGPQLARVSLHQYNRLTPLGMFITPSHIDPDLNQDYRHWLSGEILRIVEESSN